MVDLFIIGVCSLMSILVMLYAILLDSPTKIVLKFDNTNSPFIIVYTRNMIFPLTIKKEVFTNIKRIYVECIGREGQSRNYFRKYYRFAIEFYRNKKRTRMFLNGTKKEIEKICNAFNKSLESHKEDVVSKPGSCVTTIIFCLFYFCNYDCFFKESKS